MKKAFEEGWGGVIAKTVSVDSSKVPNYLNTFCFDTAVFVPVLTQACCDAPGDKCDSSVCQASIQ